ncbi:MAG: acyltransferase family protein [Gammaproteobacteria bacterium]
MQNKQGVQQQHLERRSDIQALRAIAILLVVAAHARWSLFEGGFVGVDVFFVISGYLISGLILTELDNTGRFNALDFYARRMKRLLPALFLLVGVSILATHYLTAPWWQMKEIASAKSTVLWLSNFYFSGRNTDYFSPGLENFALLHTWSLGVEEQFYMVWPWLLLFFLAYWQWQGAKGLNKPRLVSGLLATWLASMVINLLLTNKTIDAGFYLMPPRVWEFALGALVFIYRERIMADHSSPLHRVLGRSLVNLVGLVIIMGAASTYSANMAYPGLWALLPCLGSALVLLDQQSATHTSVLSRVLNARPVQYAGDISYSWYLWHWPVLLLGMGLQGTNPWTRVELVLIGLLLATASYHWIEHPLRGRKLPKPIYAWGITGIAIIVMMIGLGNWQDMAMQKAQSAPMAMLAKSRYDAPSLYSMTCDTWYHSDQLSECTFGNEAAEKTVVLLGDSVQAMWFPALAEIYVKGLGWKIIVLTKSSCSLQDVPYFYPRINRIYTECTAWRHRALDYVAQLHPDLVITGGSTKYGFTPEQWINGTKATIAKLSNSSQQVVLFSPAPDLGFDGPDCLTKKASLPEWLRNAFECTSKEDFKVHDQIASYLEQVSLQYGNVKLIRVDELVCPRGICSARRNGLVVYRDSQHITANFIHSLSADLQKLILGG